MERNRRRTDAWLSIFAVLLLVISPLENALGNDLPQILPAAVRAHAPLVFVVLLALMGLADLALLPIRRILSENPVRARSRRLRHVNMILSLGLAVLGAFAGILSPLVVPEVPGLAQVAETHQPWLTLIVPLVLLAVPVVLPLLGDWLSSRSNQDVQDREAFLHKLSRRYNHFLDDPLQQAVRARLDWRETPTALQRPEIMVESLGPGNESLHLGTIQTITPGTTLHPIFEAAHGQLLVLGAPGAGKSHQLHKVGCELVEKAQHDLTVRMPVILDLSTWAANKDPLKQWMADEISHSYNVRKDIADLWVQESRILPLLDALDVMDQKDRPLCVREINACLSERPADPVVVCSRGNEYFEMKGNDAHLTLQKALTFQPLSDAAIDQALADGHAQLDTLRRVVATDRELRDTVRTPLLLSLVILTYDNLPADAIPLPQAGNSDAWRQGLFGRYLERMLEHAPGTEKRRLHYTEKQFQTTLTWMGYQLQKHSENTFYLERLQADWLPGPAMQRHYQGLLPRIRLCLGVVVGLIGGLGIALGIGLSSWLVSSVRTGFIVGLGTGLVGMVGGLIVWEYIDISEHIKPVAQLVVPRYRLQNSQRLGLLSGLGTGLMIGLIPGVRFGLDAGVIVGLIVGLIAGVGTGIATGVGIGPEQIHVREDDLVHPNEGILQSVRMAFLIILIYGLDFGLGRGLGSVDI